ncbi:MAG TPA: SRPBCC domain-containing protein [Caulobacteraceae bacterium]|nr:SRPBCC domain-containing protein [Caulobacteraceae bacterium]
MAIKVEHRIGIQAPPDVIWEIVGDLSRWKDWNPLYTSAEGTLAFGATLTLTLVLPGGKPQVIKPVIESWTPEELIHWRLSMMGGLVKSIRYIEIEKLTETGCIFSNGEIFDGFIGRRLPKRMRRNIKAGFEAMGEAVRTRAEAAWRARAQGPT